MVGWGILVLIFSILVIVVFIVLAIVNYNIRGYKTNVNPQEYEDEYSDFAFWGPSTVSDTAPRNVCHTYNFPAAKDPSYKATNGVAYGIPAQPSMRTDVVDSLEPQTQSSCYDPDQLNLILSQHTCVTMENADLSATASFCYRFDGQRADIGDVEDYYAQESNVVNTAFELSTVSCNKTKCHGTLSLIGVGYGVTDKQITSEGTVISLKEPVAATSDTVGMKCLQSNGSGSFSLQTCDITHPGQLFRVYRKSYGKAEPSENSGLRGLYGNTMQMISRVDGGRCVTSNTVYPTLGTCNPESWVLVNEMRGTSEESVQQIAYLDGLTPEHRDEIMSTRDPDEFYRLADRYGLRSLHNENGVLKMVTFARYPKFQKSNTDDMTAAQLIDYTLFNNMVFDHTFVPLN